MSCARGARSSSAAARSTRRSCSSSRASAGPPSWRATASRRCMRSPASARTCRTTSSSTSSSPAPSPSPSIPLWGRWRSCASGCAGCWRRTGWGHQPLRGRGLRAQPRGRVLPRHPVSFPVARHLLRRLAPGAAPWLPGACRADAIEVAWPRAPALGRSRGAALDPVQLHDASRRPRGDARLRAADARDLRAGGLRPLSRRGIVARRRLGRRRGDRRLRAAQRRERLPPLRHVPHGRPGGRCDRRRPAGARGRARGPRASSIPRSCR